VEDARQIYGDYLVPFFGSDLEEAVADADAGVVDEHIDSVHHANCVGECGFHLHQVGDVGDDGLGDSRQLVTNGFARFSVTIKDADAGTFFQEACGGGCADSAGASGDEDSFVFQAAHRSLLADSLSACRVDLDEKKIQIEFVKSLQSAAWRSSICLR